MFDRFETARAAYLEPVDTGDELCAHCKEANLDNPSTSDDQRCTTRPNWCEGCCRHSDKPCAHCTSIPASLPGVTAGATPEIPTQLPGVATLSNPIPQVGTGTLSPHSSGVPESFERCCACPSAYPSRVLTTVIGIGGVCPGCLEAIRESDVA